MARLAAAGVAGLDPAGYGEQTQRDSDLSAVQRARSEAPVRVASRFAKADPDTSHGWLGAALAGRAETASDGGRLRAALDEIRVGAVADSAGTIHRVRDDR